MRQVVGQKANQEDAQGPKCHSNGSLFLLLCYAGPVVEDPDAVKIAEHAYSQGHHTKNHKKLQAHGNYDAFLVICEVFVAGGLGCSAIVLPQMDDEKHKGAVGSTEQPDENTAKDGIEKLAKLHVGDREGHSQVAVNAYSHQQQRAGINGAEEDKRHDGAHGLGKVPLQA